MLATASHDGTVKLWDLRTGTHIQTIEGHADVIHTVYLNPSGTLLLTGSRDAAVKLWDIRKNSCIGTFTGPKEWVRSVVLSQDEKYIVAGFEGGQVLKWVRATGKKAISFKGHKRVVYSMDIGHGGRCLATASGDGTVRIWDLNSGFCLRTFVVSFRMFGVRPVQFSQDGRHLLTGGFDCRARLWDLKSGRCVMTYDGGHTDWVRSVCFSRDNSFIVTGSKDHTACFWDMKSGKLLARLYHVNSGFLWTTPGDKTAKSGWIWTNRNELLEVMQKNSSTGAFERLLDTDRRKREYLATYNNQEKVMGAIENQNRAEQAGRADLAAIHEQIRARGKNIRFLE